MERKTPVAYPDGVYEIAGAERGNVILIANITQHGLTGFASTQRTALFTFFGKEMHSNIKNHSSEQINQNHSTSEDSTVWPIDGFHSIFHHRNWRAKVSCNVDINQSAGSMVM